MFVDLTHGKPIKCSKCGSTNAVNPVNERRIALRCLGCGHEKLTKEAEDFDRALMFPNRTFQTSAPKDKEPTF